MIDYLKEFEDKGFFTCADILNESEREELLSNIDQIERNVVGHPENKKEMDPNNTSRLRKINDLTLNHQYFFNISKKTEILDVIEKCIGPDIKLFGDQLFMKPPGGVEKTSHQDSPYFPISPMNLITCWIALEDVTEENGCMKFIPGSHQLGALPHSEKWMVGNREDMRIPKDLIKDKDEVSICLKAGSASFHHSLLVHRSGSNNSPHSRKGWAIHYMSSKSKWTDSDDLKPNFPLLRGASHPGFV